MYNNLVSYLHWQFDSILLGAKIINGSSTSAVDKFPGIGCLLEVNSNYVKDPQKITELASVFTKNI